MKKSELLKATKEVKNILGFEDLNEKGSVAEMTAALTEIAAQIGASGEDGIDEEELEDLSTKSKEILLSFMPKEEEAEEEAEEEEAEEAEEEEAEKTKKKAKKEKEPTKKAKAKKEEADEDELVTKIKEADLVELKAIIRRKGSEVFPVASRGLPLQKNLEKLQAKALNDLSGEPAEVPEKKEKTEKKESPSYFVRLWTCRDPKITVNEIAEKLAEKGLAHSKSSISIRRNEMILAIAILEEEGKLK